ncbi:MAG: nitrile hydratase subunit beta [Alphaproteobacteria bacterium]
MTAKYQPGERVRVRTDRPSGHCRTPHYCRGHVGEVERICGDFRNPETLAYALDGLPKQPLYRVRFSQADLWPDYDGPKTDTLDIEIYEHWLEPPA